MVAALDTPQHKYVLFNSLSVSHLKTKNYFNAKKIMKID